MPKSQWRMVQNFVDINPPTALLHLNTMHTMLLTAVGCKPLHAPNILFPIEKETK